MGTIIFLIVFPLIAAVALLILKNDGPRDIVVMVSAALIAAASIILVVQNFGDGDRYFDVDGEVIGYLMMAIEIALAIVIIWLGIKYKKILAVVLAAIQTPLMVWFELSTGHGIAVVNNLYVDRLSMIMVLIIGIIGTLICVYGIGYMKDFQKHHQEAGDRRPWFFFLMFLFLSAMFGIVVSNNLIWLYFFWEITTLCSFFLIGYNGLFHKKHEDKIATRNAFRALIMNLVGGLGFVIGIIILGSYYGTLELSTMLKIGSMGYSVAAPAIFLAFAGITKAAQMPFNSWLLGAMVAPTPTSALLHSSTMVKAGVFLIIKLAPVMGWNIAGIMVMMVGGITFLMASFNAISQSNAKKVLAYSTVANLGLIVACAGVGSPGAVWAGIMLIIFHAVTKSLLFLCVGTAEHNIGSRDIEDMDGLFERMPRLAMFMMIGIAGMFLAPMGMLISKWDAMIAFVDSNNIILILIICFGSAATAFYWAKWLGKMSAIVAKKENIQKSVHKEEWFSQGTHVVLVVLLCLCFPFVSSSIVVPYLESCFGSAAGLGLTSYDLIIMYVMIGALILIFAFFFGRTNKRIVPVYMAGAGKGDNLTYVGSMQKDTQVVLRNWYMESYFGEVKMNVIGVITTSVAIVISIGLVLGSMIGGM